MKVIALNGSPREKGNTKLALNIVGEQLQKDGINFEILEVGKHPVRGCKACGACFHMKNKTCIIKDDILNDYIPLLDEADGLLIGSPVYYASVNGGIKSFLDRLFFVSGANDNIFRHKVGACVIAVRRSGGIPAFNELNNYLLFSEMILPASNYWNVIYGREKEEASQDEEGNQIMRVLGKNMAYTLKVLDFSKDKITPPTKEDKTMTNFIK